MESIFGWLISGKTLTVTKGRLINSFMMMRELQPDITYSRNDEIKHDMYYYTTSIKSPAMQFIFASDPTIETCENNIEFDNTTFMVCLPRRSGLQLTDSGYYMAKRRLGLLKKSLV